MCKFSLSTQPLPYGFRFSLADALVLLAAFAGTAWLWHKDFPLWWLVPLVVGHFFLFCNIIRLRRSLELVWAAFFLGNVGWSLIQGSLDWHRPILWQLPLTLALISFELKSSRYHGIAAQKINSRLNEYLAQYEGKKMGRQKDFQATEPPRAD